MLFFPPHLIHGKIAFAFSRSHFVFFPLLLFYFSRICFYCLLAFCRGLLLVFFFKLTYFIVLDFNKTFFLLFARKSPQSEVLYSSSFLFCALLIHFLIFIHNFCRCVIWRRCNFFPCWIALRFEHSLLSINVKTAISTFLYDEAIEWVSFKALLQFIRSANFSFRAKEQT